MPTSPKDIHHLVRHLPPGVEPRPRAKKFFARSEFWLRFAAYTIPLCFLLYVLYWNFLPFGYDATYTITVGAPGDTSGEFHLQPSRYLSAPMTAADGSTYRELSGLAYAVFEPKAVLKNAQVTVTVEGLPAGAGDGVYPANGGVSIIPPYIDFDPNSVAWDYSWDFEKGTSHTKPVANNFTDQLTPSITTLATLLGTTSPSALAIGTTTPFWATQPESRELVGTAFPFDGAMYFDGKSKLELPNSKDEFENGPFTVYAEWTPEDPENDFQEIVGHFNWELLQDKNDVKFMVGRMSTSTGPFYTVTHPIDATFFNQRHSVLAVYSPSSTTTSHGYIELYVDGNFIDRTNIGDNTIWADYNGEQNLSFGKSNHGDSSFFKGSVYSISSAYKKITPENKSFTFTTNQQRSEIGIGSSQIGLIKRLVLTVSQNK